MNNIRKYVQTQTTRHGKTIYYFRRRGFDRIRLPNDPSSKEFAEAYYFALTEARPMPRPPKMSFDQRRKMAVSVSIRNAIKGARNRSTAAGIEFDLTESWALEEIEKTDFRCALTGIPFYESFTHSSKKSPFAPSLDRIVAGGPYIQTNVRIVIYAVNMMLLDWGEDVFSHVANCYKANRSRTPYSLTRKRRPHLRKKVIKNK
jgi:hypothetical protein